MFSQLYPESVSPFSSPHFSQSNDTRGSHIKHLTLSTDSVINKITVVHAVYFYNSDLIFATKRFVTESVLKARSFMRDILASLDWENVGWKMLYNFLGNVEKHREISTYFHLRFLSTLWPILQDIAHHIQDKLAISFDSSSIGLISYKQRRACVYAKYAAAYFNF